VNALWSEVERRKSLVTAASVAFERPLASLSRERARSRRIQESNLAHPTVYRKPLGIVYGLWAESKEPLP